MSRDERSAQVRLVGAIAGMGSGLTKWWGMGSWLDCLGSVWSSDTSFARFDTVKTRMQCSPPGTYHGAVDVLTKIVRNEGIFALYKGATPPAVGWAAIDSVLLGSLHNYRLFLLRQGMTELSPAGTPRLTLFAHGLAGLFAGWTSALIATPVELLKGVVVSYIFSCELTLTSDAVKLQLQSQRVLVDRQFKGPIDCATQVIRVQGIPGLWSGFTGSLAFRSNFFWMFLSVEVWMRGFSRLAGTPYEISTGAANFLSGGFASFVYWAMAIPFDNIKNRQMAHPYPLPYPTPTTSALTAMKRPSFLSVARHIYTRDGATGFYRGLGPCFLRAFPVNASALFVYEGMMRMLGAEKTRS